MKRSVLLILAVVAGGILVCAAFPQAKPEAPKYPLSKEQALRMTVAYQATTIKYQEWQNANANFQNEAAAIKTENHWPANLQAGIVDGNWVFSDPPPAAKAEAKKP